MIERNKSVGPDCIPGEILKMRGGSHDSVPGAIARHSAKQWHYTERLEKSHSGSYSQRRRSFDSQKLQAGQLNFSGVQTNGTRNYKTSVGRQ
jgi:hypothetical protein